MRKTIINCLKWLSAFGIEPLKTLAAIKNLRITLVEYALLKRQNKKLEKKWKVNLTYPNFHDRHDSSGVASGHYFHQDLLVARRVFQRNPIKHVDVGSRVDGFIAHIAVFREIEVFDIRSITVEIPNIKFVQGNLMNLNPELNAYCDSLSCLHALEHFGLGRYGDPIDVEGYVSGFKVLTSMVKPGGILYLSLPIGNERVEFNGHRVFSVRRVTELFAESFDLIDFSYVDDNGDLHESVRDIHSGEFNDSDLNYGCGIFEIRKRIDDH